MEDVNGAVEHSDLDSRSQVQAARSMALMDKHKQVKRQRLDRICEGEFASTLALSKNLSIRKTPRLIILMQLIMTD